MKDKKKKPKIKDNNDNKIVQITSKNRNITP